MNHQNKRHLPIGIFDSGVGGLTVMKQIAMHLPKEDIIYFGDTARLPYGEKSPETIIRYSIENANFLLQHQIKALVVACNTASAYALKKLAGLLPVPVIGMIQPGVEKVSVVTKSQRVAVLGTKGTINSQVYQKAIKERLPGSFVLAIACPLLVPLVEESFISHPATKMILEEYLAQIKPQKIDTILLACTHYPLLKEMIQMLVGSEVSVVDSASICAEDLKALLIEHKLESSKVQGHYRYFVSDDPEKFSHLASTFFDRKVENVVHYQENNETK